MNLTTLQRAILAALGPRETTTEEVRDALAAGRPSHVVTMARLLDELEALREQGLVNRRSGPGIFWWTITDAGITERVTGSGVSALEADLLLELDKAHEGDETPSVTLRRVIRQAAEAADLRSRVTALEAALGEALDGFQETIDYAPTYFVEKWGYRDALAWLRAALPAKGAT
jgi:hypothetical protein